METKSSEHQESTPQPGSGRVFSRSVWPVPIDALAGTPLGAREWVRVLSETLAADRSRMALCDLRSGRIHGQQGTFWRIWCGGHTLSGDSLPRRGLISTLQQRLPPNALLADRRYDAHRIDHDLSIGALLSACTRSVDALIMCHSGHRFPSLYYRSEDGSGPDADSVMVLRRQSVAEIAFIRTAALAAAGVNDGECRVLKLAGDSAEFVDLADAADVLWSHVLIRVSKFRMKPRYVSCFPGSGTCFYVMEYGDPDLRRLVGWAREGLLYASGLRQ